MESDPSSPRPAAPDRSFILEQLCRVHGLELLRQGCRAFRSVPGLFSRYLLGVLLTLLLAILILWGMDQLVYEPFIRPIILSIGLKLNTGWAWLHYLSSPVMWIIRVLCWMALLIMAVKLASACMGFWIDLLIERIIDHHRPGPDMPFSIRRLLMSTLRSLALAVRSLLISLIFFVLGFIPLLGVPLSFIGMACSSGADILNPYLLVLAERDSSVLRGHRLPLQRGVRIGWFQALLAMIPIIGWIAMPLLLLLQIMGTTQWVETAWKARRSGASGV